jgi:hypothetical protein
MFCRLVCPFVPVRLAIQITQIKHEHV